MKAYDFNYVAAAIAAETAHEWKIEPEATIASRISMTSVIYRGEYITSFKCYTQTQEQLYAVVVQLVKACYLFESASSMRAAA